MDMVFIGPQFGVEPGIGIHRHWKNILYCNVHGQNCIDTSYQTIPFFHGPWAMDHGLVRVKMRKKIPGMHAGVRAPAAGGFNGLP